MTIADVAAGDAGAGEVPVAAPAGFAELPADLAAAAELTRAGEGAAIAAIVPFIGTADVAIQAVGIGAIGDRLVFTVDIAPDHIAKQAAQHHAAHHRAAI